MRDSRDKYIDIANNFSKRATELDRMIKYSNKVNEKLAMYLSKQNPKTPAEFERVETLKEFVLSSTSVNEKIVELMDETKVFLQDILNDAVALMDGCILQQTIQLQSETIEGMMNERNKRADAIRADKANIKRPA